MFAVARFAGAHAFLDHAEPKVGSEALSSPAEVKVWFTDDLTAETSVVEVFDSDGKQVDKKDCHIASGNTAEMIVSLPALSAGTYRVRWHAVCPAGHKTNGEFKFVVKAKE